MLAGDDEYRLALLELRNVSSTANGNYLNLYDLEWLSPEKVWWDQNIQRDLTIGGRLTMLTGDILVADNDAMMMTMYNRPLAEPDKVGFALEALAAASDDITDSYYSVCMESKYTRDAESFEMIKLASENITYDPGFIYDWGGLGTTIRASIMNLGGNYASLIAQNAPASKQAMQDFLEDIE